MDVNPIEMAFDRPVAVFPLPNLVLFPGVTQALHIFEPRYREMVRDALEGSRLIAMALLRDGTSGDDETNDAEIYPVVCVGYIREYVLLPDGRYFLNLEGLCRARVTSEYREGPYRLALLEPMPETDAGVEPDGAMTVRGAIAEVLAAEAFDALEGVQGLRGLLRSDVPIGRAIDILASKLVRSDEVEIKQRMLEEPDAVQRGTLLLDEIRCVREILRLRDSRQAQWPRGGSAN